MGKLGSTVVVGLSLVWTTGAGAQTIRTPLDLTAGFVAGQGTPTPFRGSITGAALIQFGPTSPLRLGPAGAVIRTPADWRWAIGGRVEYRLLGVFDIGLFGQGEVLFAGNGRTPLALGLLADAGGLLRAGARYVRDLRADLNLVELVVGVDPVSWVILMAGAGSYELD